MAQLGSPTKAKGLTQNINEKIRYDTVSQVFFLKTNKQNRITRDNQYDELSAKQTLNAITHCPNNAIGRMSTPSFFNETPGRT